jgi:hypothetical protein
VFPLRLGFAVVFPIGGQPAMECVDTLDAVLAHALAVGAGIEAEADDSPFGVRLGVFLVHFELRVQSLDVPVDQVKQKLSALLND